MKSEQILRPYSRLLAAVAFALFLFAGCGAPEFSTGGNRNSLFDSGLSGSYSSYGNPVGTRSGARGPLTGTRGRGTYPKVEASFELDEVRGNPFDYTENDVLVSFERPDGQSARVPAFFDGGKTWRVRYTPDMPGKYILTRITLNEREVHPDKLEKREFEVSGSLRPGFVRIDPKDKTRFVFDNGNSFFPIGHNVAWGEGKPGDIASIFEKMGRAGENWSRVWMCHWDGKNLDWPSGNKKLEPGTLDLEVAKRWDEIVEAAEKYGIYFQMVLQHHGQYSTKVNPNWDSNPWNQKNGGFLATPDEFFSNPRAIAATKAKYRYIIARWGYSPNIMAWELFNEVEWTDAMAHKHVGEVAAWHNLMADFLRQQDPYRHLITTSSTLEHAIIWQKMDYYQPHAYPPEPFPVITAVAGRKWEKPIFFGEIGPSPGTKAETGEWLHRALWASTLSGCAGAAQWWAWDAVEKHNLYERFRPVVDFVAQSGLLSRRGLSPAAAGVETEKRAVLEFGPGAGWTAAKQTTFTVLPNGVVEGLGNLPAYFQGVAHRDMFPAATFKVNYPKAGTFTLIVQHVSAAGGKLRISVDGSTVAEKEFPGTGKDTAVHETVEAQVPAGAHEVKVENTGPDWVVVERIQLAPYAPALGLMGRSGRDYAALWVYRRPSQESDKAHEVMGKLTLAGLQSGSYKVAWWDPGTGKPFPEETVEVSESEPLVLKTPPVAKELAVYVVRTGAKVAAKASSLKK